MKIDKKYIEHLAKIIAKNYLLFSTRIFKNHDFSKELQALLNKYNDPVKTKSIIPSIVSFKAWKADDFKLLIKSASSKSVRGGLSTIESFDRKNRLEFLNDISGFLTKFSLGNEWKNTLITLVTTGEFYPPNKNFHIGGTTNDKKRVVITLNPDTSLEDLAAEWNIVKGLQKVLWPDFKKTNLTKNSMTMLKNAFNTEMGRIIEAETENRKKISYYDERFYNHVDIKKSEKIINKNRAERRKTGEDRNAKPVKFRQRISYKRLNKIISKGNAKSYNRLNQQRKRLKFS